MINGIGLLTTPKYNVRQSAGSVGLGFEEPTKTKLISKSGWNRLDQNRWSRKFGEDERSAIYFEASRSRQTSLLGRYARTSRMISVGRR